MLLPGTRPSAQYGSCDLPCHMRDCGCFVTVLYDSAMGFADKLDYPPLFAMGFHPLSLSEIRSKCADAFPLSTTRRQIVSGLSEIVSRLEASGVAGDLWIDGSFATKKINPSDADVVLVCSEKEFESGSPEHREAVHFLISNLKKELLCETYVLFTYPEDHDLHTEFLWNHGFYVGRWGWSGGNEPKGIISLKLGGGVS